MQERIEKYKTRSLNVLDENEILLETKADRSDFLIQLYKEDLDFCRANNLNVTRIIRLKFHEWIHEKFGDA